MSPTKWHLDLTLDRASVTWSVQTPRKIHHFRSWHCSCSIGLCRHEAGTHNPLEEGAMDSLTYSTAPGTKRTLNPWPAMSFIWCLARTSFAAACLALSTISVVAPAGVADAAMIDVTITVDNAYSFGFGDVNGIAASDLYGSVVNSSSCQIYCASGPEQYTVDSGSHQYAYVIAWPDDGAYQGMLGNFSDGVTLLSSVSVWEVYATGDTTSDAASTFDLATINGAISDANAGTGAANGSMGWVDEAGANVNGHAVNGSLAIDYTDTQYAPAGAGTPQSGGLAGQFHVSDHWIWYDNGNTPNPFDYSAQGDAGWVVFRANLTQVPEPTTALMLGMGLFGLGVSGGQRRKERDWQSSP